MMLLSPDYLACLQQMHTTKPTYGNGGQTHVPMVKFLCSQLGSSVVLDYGCGKGYLARLLNFPIREYDPAIPSKSARPEPADIVICTDVLEHIEPSYLDAVLDDLQRVVRRVGYFVIATGPAKRHLPDGRNAHLIQWSAERWMPTLASRWRCQPLPPDISDRFRVVVQPA